MQMNRVGGGNHLQDLFTIPSMMAESVEHGPQVLEIGSSVSAPVKSITSEIDTCHFLTWRLALIG